MDKGAQNLYQKSKVFWSVEYIKNSSFLQNFIFIGKFTIINLKIPFKLHFYVIKKHENMIKNISKFKECYIYKIKQIIKISLKEKV